MISGFTFIHNGVHGGYPFVEAIQAVMPYVDEVVVVDIQSTDETRQVLHNLHVTVIDGVWVPGGGDHACLSQAHALYKQCNGDVIVCFEADEVYDESLIAHIVDIVNRGDATNICVWRLQVEQNFQRIRWYPELVHRVFPRLSDTIKLTHTTNMHNEAIAFPAEAGFLWDCTNCFRDSWLDRIRQQNELHATGCNYCHAPLHVMHDNQVHDIPNFIGQEHWEWTVTPFKLPVGLMELVGACNYKETLKCRQLIS